MVKKAQGCLNYRPIRAHSLSTKHAVSETERKSSSRHQGGRNGPPVVQHQNRKLDESDLMPGASDDAVNKLAGKSEYKFA